MSYSLFFFFSLIISLTANTLVNFGNYGNQYDIKEQNGNDLIQDAIKKFDTKELEILLKREVEKAFKSSLNIPASQMKTRIKKLDLVKARWDITSPVDGTVLFRKGDLIPSYLPVNIELNLCFLDANESEKITKYTIEKFGKCIYVVNNMDSRKFTKKYNVESYPMTTINIEYIKRFNIEYLPTKITKKDKFITTTTINVIELRRTLEDENFEKIN